MLRSVPPVSSIPHTLGGASSHRTGKSGGARSWGHHRIDRHAPQNRARGSRPCATRGFPSRRSWNDPFAVVVACGRVSRGRDLSGARGSEAWAAPETSRGAAPCPTVPLLVWKYHTRHAPGSRRGAGSTASRPCPSVGDPVRRGMRGSPSHPTGTVRLARGLDQRDTTCAGQRDSTWSGRRALRG
jgi:hypothetical protein